MKIKFQSGQTLIETLVALFILIMGITAAVGLAIFALNSSNNVVKQIVATGLAREGIEAVRNMRDTNWLRQTTINTNCYNFSTGLSDAKCYRNWNSQLYSLAATNQLKIREVPSDANYWQMSRCNIKYGLDFDSDINGINFMGYFTYPVPGVACNAVNPGVDVTSAIPDPSGTVYARRILLTNLTTAPFNSPEFPKIRVTSQVWWSGNKCPKSNVWPGLNKCSVEMITYLTNWKDY